MGSGRGWPRGRGKGVSQSIHRGRGWKGGLVLSLSFPLPFPLPFHLPPASLPLPIPYSSPPPPLSVSRLMPPSHNQGRGGEEIGKYIILSFFSSSPFPLQFFLTVRPPLDASWSKPMGREREGKGKGMGGGGGGGVRASMFK